MGSHSKPATQAELIDSATVAGVIKVEGDENPACDDISIRAENAPIGAVGKFEVRQSRARCSYEVRQLPADTDVTLSISAPEGWKCQNGSPVAFSPTSMRLTLRRNETRVLDFTGRCKG
jgi:hypothetical protein